MKEALFANKIENHHSPGRHFVRVKYCHIWDKDTLSRVEWSRTSFSYSGAGGDCVDEDCSEYWIILSASKSTVLQERFVQTTSYL